MPAETAVDIATRLEARWMVPCDMECPQTGRRICCEGCDDADCSLRCEVLPCPGKASGSE